MSAAKVEHAPAGHHAADGHKERRKRSGAEKAMAWGIGIDVASYGLSWLAYAAGSVALGFAALGTFVVGSALALGGLAASIFRRKKH